MKAKGYLLFSFILGAVVGVTSLVAVLITALSASKSQDFPVYAYHQYIDRTSNMLFSINAGAQLYESENAEVSGGAEEVFNSLASGGKVVGSIKKDSVLKYGIIFEEECTVQLKLSVCYVSDINRDTYAQNLFSVCLNGVELATRRANIAHGYSDFDFKENLLCTMDFPAGRNIIEFISEMEGYEIDYMLLVPMTERTSSETTIGLPVYNYKSDDRVQRFEAEHAERENAYAEYNLSSSGRYYTVNETEKASNIFWVESDKNTRTELAIALKNYGNTDTMSEFCDVYVNDEKLLIDVVLPIENVDGKFSESSLGRINLKQGLNEIAIINKSGAYCLDYIALNASINYTKDNVTFRYEAEDSILSGGCVYKKDLTASAENIVSNNVPDSYVSYTVCSCVEDAAYFSICLNYSGNEDNLGNVVEIVVNSRLINLSDKAVYKSSSYIEIYLGLITIEEGNNVFIIRSLSGNYELDYFALSNMEFSFSGQAYKYEAENALLFDGSQVEWDKKASGSKIAGSNIQGSSVNFSIMCNDIGSAKLSLSLSCVSRKNILMNDNLSIIVNGQTVNISGLNITTTEDWSTFMENAVGNIRLKEGLNLISIVSKAELYTLDYICLTAIT